MGLFWDLIQESKIQEQKEQSESLEERVTELENDLSATRALLQKTLIALEEHVGKDIDGDGITGE